MTGRLVEARTAAAAFRAEQHLGSAPIADLVTVLEDCPGIHVAVLPGGAPSHHGMRASDPQRQVTVLGAAATPHPVRLRSTLAHELGHHVFCDPTPSTWSEKTAEEVRATEFARHLLLPEDGLIDLLGTPGSFEITDAVLSKVVERFAVSPQMAAIQLQNARFITPVVATRFKQLSTPVLATRYGWSALYRQWSADSEVVRPPRRIIAAAINAYIGGDVTVETLANLRESEAHLVLAELREAGIRPTGREDSGDDSDVDDDFDWNAIDNRESVE